jgi:hypothetical protein
MEIIFLVCMNSNFESIYKLPLQTILQQRILFFNIFLPTHLKVKTFVQLCPTHYLLSLPEFALKNTGRPFVCQPPEINHQLDQFSSNKRVFNQHKKLNLMQIDSSAMNPRPEPTIDCVRITNFIAFTLLLI